LLKGDAMVCPHCKTEYNEPEHGHVCKACGALEGDEGPRWVNAGDETLTVCGACEGIEQGTKEVEICPNCWEALP